MTGTVAQIWRHPIKSHGREELAAVTLTAGRTLPWDRAWAVAHEASRADGSAWAPCANFSRVAKAPALQAIDASLDEATGTVTLTHPERAPLTFRPDDGAAPLLQWVDPLMPADRAASARIVRWAENGMTDSDFPSISIANLSSHRAVADRLGQPDLSPLRWRANLWLDGLGPWQEFEWIGRRLRVGEAELEVRERIVRCLATSTSPQTGRRDVDMLGTLEGGWGHREFGVYAVVIAGGRVARGDSVELLP